MKTHYQHLRNRNGFVKQFYKKKQGIKLAETEPPEDFYDD